MSILYGLKPRQSLMHLRLSSSQLPIIVGEDHHLSLQRLSESRPAWRQFEHLYFQLGPIQNQCLELLACCEALSAGHDVSLQQRSRLPAGLPRFVIVWISKGKAFRVLPALIRRHHTCRLVTSDLWYDECIHAVSHTRGVCGLDKELSNCFLLLCGIPAIPWILVF